MRRLLRPMATAAALGCAVAVQAARAEPAAEPDPPAAAQVRPEAAPRSVGGLSLFALGGSLFAGVMIGLGFCALRRPRPAGPQVARTPEEPAPAETETAPPMPPRRAKPLASLSDDASLDRVARALADGPGYRPVATAVLAADRATQAYAIARLAEAARRADLDVAAIDCTSAGRDDLARALDACVDAPPAREPFGASARIRLVDPEGARSVGALRRVYAVAGDDADVVLVDAAPLRGRQPSPALAAADAILLVDDGATDLDAFVALNQNGPRVAGRLSL